MGRVPRLKRLRLPGILSAGLIALLPSFSRAQVLEQVPSDAVVVVRVKNLQQLSDKTAVLAKKWGLDQMVPQLADPITAWFDLMKFKGGVEKNSDAAFVLTGLDLEAATPPILILLPVTDYAAFVANFTDAKKDGELDVVHMEVGGNKENDDTFIAHWGKYAVLTPNKALLSKKPDGFKVQGVTAKEFDSKDITETVNFKVLGPTLLAPVKQNREKIIAEVEKGLAKEAQFNQKFTPVVKAMVVQGLAIAEEFLTDAEAVTLGTNLNADGITLSLVTEFTAGSYLGTAFSAIKNTDAKLLTGLPAGKYIIFGASTGGGEAALKVTDDVLKPIMAELAKTGDDGKPIVDYIEALRSLVKSSTGSALGLVAPTGALGTSPLVKLISVYTGDAKAIAAAQQSLLESQEKLMKELMPKGATGPVTQTKFTPNAKEIDGVKFNQFSTVFAADDNTPGAAQAKQMLAIIYGPEGATGYTGEIDATHLLIFSGLDDAAVSEAIKAVKANTDVLSDTVGVALVNKNLPASRVANFYLALDTLLNTASNYAKMMGVPIPIEFKPDLPPLAGSISTEGTALRFDGFIPADVVQEVMAAAIKYQMLKGAKPGQPGGL